MGMGDQTPLGCKFIVTRAWRSWWRHRKLVLVTRVRYPTSPFSVCLENGTWRVRVWKQTNFSSSLALLRFGRRDFFFLFPSHCGPQYWAGSNRVNFGVRMRTGALRLIWSNPYFARRIMFQTSRDSKRSLQNAQICLKCGLTWQASVAEWLRRQTQVLVNFVGVSTILTRCSFWFRVFLGVPPERWCLL